MSDFSDRPFAMGSVIGLRAFAVDTLGRLVGPSMAEVFTPGVNEAKCLKSEFNAKTGWLTSASMSFVYTAMYPRLTWGGADEDEGDDDKPVVKKVSLATAAVDAKADCEHALGGLGCTCGFYAYFDGANDYKNDGNIAAIIEGFGVCSVGTRGFRAAKARLVALIEPKSKVPPLRFDYVRRNYPDVPVYRGRKAAIAAHPLTLPEVPTPSTCDDFWTRKAS